MEKIDVKNIKRGEGFAFDDLLREGVAPSHDRLKIAAVIKVLVDTVNTLIEKVEALEKR